MFLTIAESWAGLAIGRIVVQPDFAAGALLGRIYDAGIERPRIHVQTYRPLLEFTRIEDTMHRLQWINRARMRRIHLDSFRGFELADAFVQILRDDPVILNQESPDRRRHPAILVAMIVDRTHLTDFPADRDQLIKRRLVDEVAGVMLAIPGQIWTEGVRGNRRIGEKSDDLIRPVKSPFGKFPQLRDKMLYANLPGQCL
jgi:hypothetical protein